MIKVGINEHTFARLCNACLSEDRPSSVVVGHHNHTQSAALCPACLLLLRDLIDAWLEGDQRCHYQPKLTTQTGETNE